MEALVLAAEAGATLLIDEYVGRKETEAMGIEHFGSLRVLKEAKDRSIISEIKPLLDELIASGTYLSESLYEEFLRASGEPVATWPQANLGISSAKHVLSVVAGTPRPQRSE